MALIPISMEAFKLLVMAVLFLLALLLAGGVALLASMWRRRGSHPPTLGCPHCGRNVLPQTSVCPACGGAMDINGGEP